MDSDSSYEDFAVVRSESRDVRSHRRARELAEMSDEQHARYMHFITSCSFPVATVKSLMQEQAPEGTSIQNPAAATAANAAKLFVGEVAETARKLAKEGQPLTPDLIYVAFDLLLQQGKVPGCGTTRP